MKVCSVVNFTKCLTTWWTR